MATYWLGIGGIELAEGLYEEARDACEKGAALFREIGQQDELALILSNLVLSEVGLGKLDDAHRHLHEVLRIVNEIGAFAPGHCAIACAAVLLAQQGEVERAVELHALVMNHPYFGASQYRAEVIGRPVAAAAADLPPALIAAAQERGRAGDWQATVRALLAEFNPAAAPPGNSPHCAPA